MRPSSVCSLAQSASTLSQRRLVRVQLLVDTPGLGKAGHVCLVQPGRMRNALLPSKQAVYQPLPSLTERLREEAANKLLEQQIAEVKQQLEAQKARAEVQKDLGPVQLLSLRRKLERVPHITLLRRTTRESNVPAGQLPDPPLQIQGSVSVDQIVDLLRERYRVFELETDFAKDGIPAPLNRLTAQQISNACKFNIVSEQSEDSEKPGKIKRTGKYELLVKIHATKTEVRIPFTVLPFRPAKSKATISTATPPPRAMSTPAGARAFSSSAASKAPTGIENSMRSKIEAAFAPAEINIRNDSSKHAHHAAMAAQGGGNGETHFFVEVISDAFEGMTQIKRHRAVNALMADEFEKGLHALSLRTKTRKEVERANSPRVRTEVSDGTTCPNTPSSATSNAADTASTSTSTSTSTHLPSPVDDASYWTAPESSLHPTSPTPGRARPGSEGEPTLDEHLRQSRKFFRRVTKNEDAPPARWQRIANVLGGIAGSAAAFYLVAMADFGEKEHCFTPLRKALFGDERGWNPFRVDEDPRFAPTRTGDKLV